MDFTFNHIIGLIIAVLVVIGALFIVLNIQDKSEGLSQQGAAKCEIRQGVCAPATNACDNRIFTVNCGEGYICCST